MDEKTLFTGRAESYTRGRTGYAPQLLDFLVRELKLNENSTLADIGAGTGIFSRQLAGLGCNVICVEPNGDMLAAARGALAELSNVRFSSGGAEATGLADSSVDAITAAQAFHWFDVPAFRAESQRILRPGGKAALVWNSRDGKSPTVCAQVELFKKHCPRFKGFSEGMKKDDPRIALYFGGAYDYAEFENPITYTRDKFISRCHSSSYSLRPGDEGFEAYTRDISEFFDKFSSDGTLTLPNRSVVYFGRV